MIVRINNPPIASPIGFYAKITPTLFKCVFHPLCAVQILNRSKTDKKGGELTANCYSGSVNNGIIEADPSTRLRR